jgi:hypothetical protein
MLWKALFERVIHVSGASASDDHALKDRVTKLEAREVSAR